MTELLACGLLFSIKDYKIRVYFQTWRKSDDRKNDPQERDF